MSRQFDYLIESKRTLSDKFYGKEVKANHVRQLLISFSNSAFLLDKVKKGVFYGKEIELLPKGKFHFGYAEDEKDIFHAIIGIATEAGELAEAYLKAWDDGKVDVVNLCEEIGDVFWYAAIIAREAGVSFEDIQRNNIEKLAKRFPDKFTEFNANNRDLAGEREILESLTIDDAKTGIVLPKSIQPEVGCISKSDLIKAFKAMQSMAPIDQVESPEEVTEWIFKNFA